MGLFSGLKRLFGSHQCPCQEARLYTQKEMDEYSRYWIANVEKAKLEVEKSLKKQFDKKEVGVKRTKKKRTPEGFKLCNLGRKKQKKVKEGLNKFIKHYCFLCDEDIDSNVFSDVYIWWCSQNNYIPYYGKLAIGHALQKLGVKRYDKNPGKKQSKGSEYRKLMYLGIRIMPSLYQEYLLSKKPQITHSV